MIVACQWNISSPTGPAEHCAGGSCARSFSSLWILFRAMVEGCLGGPSGMRQGLRARGCLVGCGSAAEEEVGTSGLALARCAEGRGPLSFRASHCAQCPSSHPLAHHPAAAPFCAAAEAVSSSETVASADPSAGASARARARQPGCSLGPQIDADGQPRRVTVDQG